MNENQLSDRLREAADTMEYISDYELLREAADALESALPGDVDWEYGTAHASEPEKGAPEPNRRAAELRRNAWNDTTQSRTSLLVSRRPAGPWEPVEEVPRG